MIKSSNKIRSMIAAVLLCVGLVLTGCGTQEAGQAESQQEKLAEGQYREQSEGQSSGQHADEPEAQAEDQAEGLGTSALEISPELLEYRDMNYGEFREKSGREAEFLHGTFYFALLEELVPGFLTVRLTELDLSMLARLLDIFSGMSRLQLLPEMEPDIKIREIAEAQKAGYISLLKKLPLGEEGRNVGIYGTGRHTEGMLAVYRKLIGEIRCNLIFIDSRRDNEKYHGCQLIHYQKISSQPLDMVVISSFIYQQEMISNLNKVRIDVPIITFYDGMDWDVFSECEKFLRINI